MLGKSGRNLLPRACRSRAPDNTMPAEQLAETTSLFGYAWLALAAALAIHVVDEALTDFLSVYNPTVGKIHARFPWIPLPTFSFRVWIVGLSAGITLMFSLSPLAFQGARWIVVAAVPLSVMMVGNGLGHIGGSIYMRRLMPGVYSSPVLIAASLFLLIYALRLL
jgi:hypothetical protein